MKPVVEPLKESLSAIKNLHPKVEEEKEDTKAELKMKVKKRNG